ncbi:hypothetical protein [Polluticaenibacter yanchengensis]|uniref:Uncharacterized protein n=1 Tax=Polluticaenibacter yanchengensis TaxID=3014562 RepID=A0ABT4UP99_9BACT|nr:hypothetical protein [Chitinophagaceae bacterium LY-5]
MGVDRITNAKGLRQALVARNEPVYFLQDNTEAAIGIKRPAKIYRAKRSQKHAGLKMSEAATAESPK